MTTPNSFAWHSFLHRDTFDFRARQPLRVLRRDYESLNDIQLLNESIRQLFTSLHRPVRLLEIGCATGELYRYLSSKHKDLEYTGMDISKSCIDRAYSKYPHAIWHDSWSAMEKCDVLPDIIYCKDVIHHQPDPLEFITRLIALKPHTLIFRCRTLDEGTTEWNPDLSCQFVYGAWVPYIVINLFFLMKWLAESYANRDSTIEAIRSYIILGGSNQRYLPKSCYFPSSGTSETSIRVVMDGSNRFLLADQPDNNPHYTPLDYLSLAVRRLLIWK